MLRRRAYMLTAALALSAAMPGCTTSTPSTPIATVADSAILTGTQRLTQAEYAYHGAASTALVLVQAGMIHGAAATTLRDLNQRASAALAVGYSAVDEAERARAALTILSIVAEIQSLGAAK